MSNNGGESAKEIFRGWENYSFPDKKIEEIAKKRMEICKQCKHLTSEGRCKKCGCFMLFKTRIKKTRCPINLW